MGRPRRCFTPSLPRMDAPVDTLLLVEVLGCRLRLWRDCQPEPFPRYSRDLA